VFISSICSVRQRTVIFGKPPAVGPTAFGFAQGRLSHNAVYECMVRFADTLQIVSFPAMACWRQSRVNSGYAVIRPEPEKSRNYSAFSSR